MISRKRIVEIFTNVTRMYATFGLVLLTAATVGAFGAELHAYLDWLPSFSHLYVVFGALGAVALFATGGPKRAVWCAAIAALHLVAVAPWFIDQPTPKEFDGVDCAPDASVLVINAYLANLDYQRVVDHIVAEDAELVYVSELASGLHEMIAPHYPYIYERADNTFGGMALYSRYPLENVQHVASDLPGPLQVMADIQTPTGTVRVLGVHPPAPGVPLGAYVRDAMIEEFARVTRNSPHPVLLIGDLNITMWSPHYRPLEDAGLVNARRGRGVMATFPAKLPTRIPIDHVMATPDVAVCDLEVGPNINSDHLPLTATVRWPRPAAARLLASR